MEIVKKHSVKLENLSLKEFRQRLFVKQSEILYGKTFYDKHYVDDVPEQIEALDGFTDWESFSKSWDVYWVGLDPRSLQWIAGRHHSPIRKIVSPVRIVKKDERTNRMLETYLDKADVRDMEVPIKEPIPETEEDRIISKALTGKVVVDEPDIDKAERLIKKNMEMLQQQLASLGIKQ